MSTDKRGREIRVFLADGTATGILVAAIIGWTGKALVAPRTLLPGLLKREETGRTGVYFLSGPDPQESGRDRVYIGEGDNVAERLRTHNNDEKRDFFTRVTLFTSTDDYLTKAHVRFLESRLIRMTGDAGRVILDNGTEPSFTGLPEADQANMEDYLENMGLLLPVLGFDLLKKPPVLETEDVIPGTGFYLNQVGVQAFAYESEGEFIVRVGSHARKDGVASWDAYVDLRDSLVESGKLEQDQDSTKYRFKEDVPFNSPSAAASVVLARNSNGRTNWRVQDSNQTYSEWQEANIDVLN